MNLEEKFQSQVNNEHVNNNSEYNQNYREYTKLEKLSPYSDEAIDKDKKIIAVREEIKNYFKTAELISVTSTPRSEIDKSKANFLKFVFPKLNNHVNITDKITLPVDVNDSPIDDEEIIPTIKEGKPEVVQDEKNKIKENLGVIKDFKDKPAGIKNLFKKLFF